MHTTQQQRCIVLKLVRTFAQLQKQQQTHVAVATANSCFQLAATTEQRKSTNTTTATLHSLLQKINMSSIPSAATTRTSFTTLTVRQPLHFPQHQLRSYSKFTAATELPTLGNKPLCEKRAHDLIFNLKDSEYEAIKAAMAKFEAQRVKAGFEGKLAATQWRTRFGRLSKVPPLGDVDPTGTFCAFPDGWFLKKAAEKAVEPSSRDLSTIFFVNAVPFVVFGFLDNFTMIIAGDYIEYAVGYFMCISTMAAAGLGNTLSDILGIGSAFYVEKSCALIGLRPPDLTPVQLDMKSSRRAANYGRIIGITVGCLLGMTPLLFIKKKADAVEEKKEEKKEEEMQQSGECLVH